MQEKIKQKKKSGLKLKKEEDLGDSRTKRFGTTGV
jgi:hypothetical protein